MQGNEDCTINIDDPKVLHQAMRTLLPLMLIVKMMYVDYFCSKPECSAKYTSEVLPPHLLDTKAVVPCGVIPIRYFTVL